MFGQFHHLPVHALAVHAAVVMVPLAALLGVLFAVPLSRNWSRYPLLLVTIGAAGSVFVAKESGQHLDSVLGSGVPPQVAEIIGEHRSAANRLFVFILIFTAVAIVAFVLSRNAAKFDGPLAIVVSAVLVIGAAVVAYQTYKTGELGSKAVWNPTGDVDYSQSSVN
jgi:hypothetical protein